MCVCVSDRGLKRAAGVVSVNRLIAQRSHLIRGAIACAAFSERHGYFNNLSARIKETGGFDVETQDRENLTMTSDLECAFNMRWDEKLP